MSIQRIVTAVLALSLVAGVAQAGGRAHVSILTTPKQVVAGKTFEVAFSVRPEFPMAKDRKIEPIVRATCGDQTITVAAVPLKHQGEFKASLTVPREGDWTISVDSRYCETRMQPLILKAEPQSVRS